MTYIKKLWPYQQKKIKLKKGELNALPFFYYLARPVGFEPTPTALDTVTLVLKTSVLPLH